MLYLESMSREAGSRPDLQREVARGYARIGEVQGGIGEANLGQFPAALASPEKAESIFATLVRRSPGDSALVREYNGTAVSLARLYLRNDQFAKALALSRKSVAIAEAAIRTAPNDPANVDDIVVSLSTLADLYTDQQHYFDPSRSANASRSCPSAS
jgi:hypothetical protein